LCEKWFIENKKRFVNCELITSGVNTGIAPNCNRGVFASGGEWMKLLAGDDLLLPDCIKDNMIHIKLGDVLFSRVIYFSENNSIQEERALIFRNYYKDNEGSFQGNQFKEFLKRDYIEAASFFIKAGIIKKIGGYDERIPFKEDAPMWHKLLSKGYVFSHFKKETVMQRVHESSITGKNDERFLKSAWLYFKYYEIKDYLRQGRILEVWDRLIMQILIRLKENKINRFAKYILLLSPLSVLRYLKKTKINITHSRTKTISD
jgi:alpha-1,3-rhamnosyltransferase